MSAEVDKLEHAYFESVTFPGADTGTLLSIATRSDGQRLKISYEHQDGKVLSSLWDKEHYLTNLSGLTHVHLTQVTGSTATPCVDLEEVPVSPSFYPAESLNVTVYENSQGEEWAIGRDASNNLWTFFKKPNRFGDYWIASEVLASQKNENERINEKLNKGYKPAANFQCWFDPLTREIDVRF